MKRPAFQFYPADWRKDAALQSCSMAAQGLWINVLCVMHECEPYGHLSINGKPMQPAQIARLFGMLPKECDRLLTELREAGVFATTEDGFLFSRRMVKDEHLRNVRAESGRLGGNPNLVKQKDNQPPNQPGKQSPTPSSSSSSSRDTPVVPKGTRELSKFPPGFDAFWNAYPRKVGRDAAAKAFARRRVSQDLLALMLLAIEQQRASDQWTRDGGKFIPHPSTWLNGGRWADEPDEGEKPWVHAR